MTLRIIKDDDSSRTIVEARKTEHHLPTVPVKLMKEAKFPKPR